MGMASAPIYPGTIKSPTLALTTANTTAAFTDFWTPSTSAGGKLESIGVSQDSTDTIGLDWAISTGGASYPIGCTTAISSGAGTDGTIAAVDALSTASFPFARSDGINRYLLLGAGYKLQVRLRAPLDAGKTMYLYGQGGDF